MQAMAVIDRIFRALASVSEHIFATLDPVRRPSLAPGPAPPRLVDALRPTK